VIGLCSLRSGEILEAERGESGTQKEIAATLETDRAETAEIDEMSANAALQQPTGYRATQGERT